MNESVSLNLSVKVLNANKLREHEFVKYNLFPYSIYFRSNYLGKNSYTIYDIMNLILHCIIFKLSSNCIPRSVYLLEKKMLKLELSRNIVLFTN